MVIYTLTYLLVYIYQYESPYDDTHSHMTQLIVSGEYERYELKVDYVAMDQVCTWSHYQVDILLYEQYIYIMCIVTR